LRFGSLIRAFCCKNLKEAHLGTGIPATSAVSELGESVGAAQEYRRCAVIGVLVVGMLLAEVFG
jgi:hypothetical protein